MSDLKNKDFLFSMLKIASPSGEEIGLQKYLIEAMKDVDDKVYTHHNMNVVHAINPDSKMKVLLSGHVDEISLVIEEIRANGTCRLCSNGNVRAYCYIAQHVVVYSKDENYNTKLVPGVITYLPGMDKGITVNDLILDLGVDSKEEAEKLVSIGDAVCHMTDYVELSGGKLESILEKLTSNRLMAVLLGAGVTAVIQSSSATTVMVVGFVNSGIMMLSSVTFFHSSPFLPWRI